MKRGGAAGTFLLAHGNGEAQLCVPQPSGVDPVNGNFTPTTWVDGSLSWVNNAVGGFFNSVWANRRMGAGHRGDKSKRRLVEQLPQLCLEHVSGRASSL